MENIVYVVREGDKDGDYIIGVADDLDIVDDLLKEYYGNFKEICYQDIRDSGIEYTKIIEVLDHLRKPYQVTIIVDSFTLNEI